MTDERVSSSQYGGQFGGLGFLEVCCGDLILRGRNGERDHLYPLERAAATFSEMEAQRDAMVRNGIRGWDQMCDYVSEFKAKLLEAAEQRRGMNRRVPESLAGLLSEASAERKITVTKDYS